MALAGYGLAGRQIHAPLIRAEPGVRLATVVTSNADRQAQAREDNPGVQVLPRLADLWAKAAEHDLLVVATPTGTHVEVGLAAVAHRLPLVVDKPVASTAAQGRRLVAAAAEAGVLLSVFQNRRWDSDTLTIERLLTAGELGAVHRFESRFERWRPEARAGAWREETSPSEGGGILLDLGSHVVDQALALFGPAERVFAEVAARRPGSVEDDAFIAVFHRGGVTSHLWVSAVAAIPGPRVRVLGSAGAYVQERLDGQEDALRSGLQPSAPRWGMEADHAWGRLVTADGDRRIEPVAGNWPAFYAGVVAALQEGAPNPVTGASAVAGLEVIDAARRSAGREVVTLA